MKKLKTIFNLCLIGLPFMCFSQNTKKIDVEKLNISIELNENWKIKNFDVAKYILIENTKLESKFRIQNSDYQKTYEKIFKSKNLKCSRENFNKLTNLKKTKNLKISFNISDSKVKDNSEIITMDKIINDKAYLIKANIPYNCSKCKEEFESIISTIEQI
jgi:hypothetical protein